MPATYILVDTYTPPFCASEAEEITTLLANCTCPAPIPMPPVAVKEEAVTYPTDRLPVSLEPSMPEANLPFVTAPVWIASVWILPIATDDAITSAPSDPLSTLAAGTTTPAISVPAVILPAAIDVALTPLRPEPSP